jgi:hypothetical protein
MLSRLSAIELFQSRVRRREIGLDRSPSLHGKRYTVPVAIKRAPQMNKYSLKDDV